MQIYTKSGILLYGTRVDRSEIHRMMNDAMARMAQARGRMLHEEARRFEDCVHKNRVRCHLEAA